MNRPQQRTRSNQRRRPQSRRSSGVDIWRSPAPLPDVEPIVRVNDPGAMLRSLGDPPMTSGNMAGHYFNFVITRSAAVAMALAWSADLAADLDVTEG
jgi:hypothetical protein